MTDTSVERVEYGLKAAAHGVADQPGQRPEHKENGYTSSCGVTLADFNWAATSVPPLDIFPGLVVSDATCAGVVKVSSVDYAI